MKQEKLTFTLKSSIKKPLDYLLGWSDEQINLYFVCFLQECLKRKGLPFRLNQDIAGVTLTKSILEANRITKFPEHEVFYSIDQLFNSLEE